MTIERPLMRSLCDEVMKTGDILACYVINQGGELLAANYGMVPVDDALKKDFSEVAATIWGGLMRVTGLAGRLEMVSAIYENMKIIGLPVQGTNVALLLTVDVKIDSYALKGRLNDFLKYWLMVNHYVESP
jgi:hypothetical protein